jgi:DNA-damage-inducible protein J
MASTLVQFRTEDTEKIKAVQILDRLGLSLPSYLRMCVSRLNQENGIPFSMKIETEENPGISALKRASRIAEENGIADMSLDEINAEIAEARK